MEKLTENLYIIKNQKEKEIKRIVEDDEEGSVRYSILLEEINDINYSLNVINIDDPIEKYSYLSDVISTTTSNSILSILLDYRNKIII